MNEIDGIKLYNCLDLIFWNAPKYFMELYLKTENIGIACKRLKVQDIKILKLIKSECYKKDKN